jgi:hypothetical protein
LWALFSADGECHYSRAGLPCCYNHNEEDLLWAMAIILNRLQESPFYAMGLRQGLIRGEKLQFFMPVDLDVEFIFPANDLHLKDW